MAGLLYLKRRGTGVALERERLLLLPAVLRLTYYEPQLPCDATQIGRFMRAVGPESLEQLRKALTSRAIKTQ